MSPERAIYDTLESSIFEIRHQLPGKIAEYDPVVDGDGENRLWTVIGDQYGYNQFIYVAQLVKDDDVLWTAVFGTHIDDKYGAYVNSQKNGYPKLSVEELMGGAAQTLFEVMNSENATPYGFRWIRGAVINDVVTHEITGSTNNLETNDGSTGVDTSQLFQPFQELLRLPRRFSSWPPGQDPSRNQEPEV